MTPLGKAVILKRDQVDPAKTTSLPPSAPSVRNVGETQRRIGKEAVEASLLAKRILSDARREAEALLAAACEEAKRMSVTAVLEAREQEVAKLAAGFLALADAEERRAERDLERAVALARVLAERLLGEALETDPSRVAALARQALLEARGARQVVIEASPLDVEALRSHVLDIGLAEGALDIKVDPSLSLGSLRIHTNLGSLDAQLTPQLDRLAKALRDALT